VLGTYRVEEAQDQSPLRRWLDELGPGRSYQPITLQRLSTEETKQALALWLGSQTPATSSWLYGQTEDNPLFMRELVHSLLHSQILSQDEEGRWRVMTGEPGSAYLPESMRELIGASLRRLSERERQLVGMMAVLGRSFEFDLCREMVRQPRERLISKLERLCRVGLLVEREGRYQFHHELIRQVLYDELSTERKRLWHRQIGQTLEELYPQRLDELSPELAEHFERAQQWEKAIIYAERAGLQGEKDYAYGAARKFFVKALKLLDHLEKPSSLRGRRIKLRLLSRYLSARVFPTISDIIAALEEVRTAVLQMIALAQELGDDARLCDAYHQQARVAMAEGSREAAQEALQRALSLSQNIAHASTATTMEHIGRLYRQLGEYRRAVEVHQRAAQIGIELGDLSVQGKARADIAIIQMFLGQLMEARQNMEQAHELVQAARNRRLQASVLNNFGIILHELGQYERARTSYEQAYHLMSEEGDPRGMGIVMINMGTLASDQGEYGEALGYFERVVDMLSVPGLKGLEIGTLSEKGRAHLGRGELDLSLKCSERAVSILEAEQGISTEAQRFYFTHYEILQANQRHGEARLYLQKAYEELHRTARQIREETLRTGFLENVRINHQIVQAWQAAQNAP
jgi:tetratricopeptide (TPR) repeat protein